MKLKERGIIHEQDLHSAEEVYKNGSRSRISLGIKRRSRYNNPFTFSDRFVFLYFLIFLILLILGVIAVLRSPQDAAQEIGRIRTFIERSHA